MADQATEEEIVVDCECGHGGEEGSMVSLERKQYRPTTNFYT
jgi:hypothetical protein